MGSPSDTGPTPPNGNNNNDNNSPPPYRTRSITRRQEKAPPNRPRPRPRPTYYQPQVHQFTCRGAFHLKKDVDVNNNPNRSDPPKYNNDNITSAKEAERQSREYLEDMIKDTFVCKGIQSRLTHVADYPLARSKEEAINWFQGVEGQSYMTSSPGIGGSTNNNDRGNNGRGNPKNQNNNQKQEEGTDVMSSDDADSFSSYGTTQVNILTLQEIPGISSEEMQPSVFDDPFGGFGAIPATGIFNPFGSLFGAFGAPSPWDMDSPQDGANSHSGGNKSWMRAGSRSVSSSTRTHRDESGKRVVTTVTETVTVDDNGKRKTETETTVRHLDDGGRVETKKEVHAEDGDDVGNGDEPKNASSAPRVAPSAPMFGPPAIVAPAGPPTSPPEVAVIDTETLFGVAITDAAGQHPDDVDYQPNQRGGDGSGWRRTEFLFRLGRFIPPFMLVSQYYDSRGVEAKRNKEEYDRMRQRVKKERLDNAKGRDKGGNEVDGNTVEDEVTNSLPNYGALSSSNRMQEFFEKLREQMEKNARMMQIIGKEVIKPDFPGKVKKSGEKIIDNFGPTVERAMKLASDVFEMWTGWSGDEGNNGRRR